MTLAVWLAGGLGCAVDTAWTEEERARIGQMTPIPAPPARPSNRWADDPDAAALGAALFFDPTLSRDGATSCASCHDPARGFTNGARFATTSLGTGARNVPPVHTAAWSTWYFWDGRVDSAWAQAMGPLTNPIEHGLDAAGVRAVVAERYASTFEAVFGGVSEDPEAVLVAVGKALEAYERTLRPPETRFDLAAAAVAAGGEPEGYTPAETLGMKTFLRRECVACHHGPLLTDQQFHNLGLPSIPKDGIDPGRARGAPQVLVDPHNCASRWSDAPPDACAELQYLDPSFDDWAAAFKTPSLRDVARTGPYMHDGQFDSLEAVVAFYDALPGKALVGHRELTLKPLNLTAAEREGLVAFLRTLSPELSAP